MAETQAAPLPFFVAGIGASAGGIAALQTFFRALPPSPELALVVLQHAMPDPRGHLVHLLRSWSAWPVSEVMGGSLLEPGRIHVPPPDRALGLDGLRFVLSPLSAGGPRPGIDNIDAFFELLAARFGERAIGVILSGTGSDGAAGALRIKQQGGAILVQDPATALHEAMPQAAIANGAADQILPLGELAGELAALASRGEDAAAPEERSSEDVTAALEGILEQVAQAGVDLQGYKTSPLLWRIQQRMKARRVPLFHHYAALLHDDAREMETLIRSIPIHVTSFFRDPKLWELLEQRVIPRLFAEGREDEPIRAWTPAAATGEEAYSLAMLLAEQAARQERPAGFQLFVTDASTEVISRARRGVFSTAAAQVLSPERRQRFLYAADGACRARRALREQMVFAPQDLLADPPFPRLDLITCRNLLIYLEREAADRVLHRLHHALRLGGYLFLGKAESLSRGQQAGLEEVEPGSRIYRKVAQPAALDPLFPKRPARMARLRSSEGAVLALSHEAAVAERELPAVIIDEHFQIIRIFGDTSPFLRLRPGEPTLDVLELASPAFAVCLRRAAQEAREGGRPVTFGLSEPAGEEGLLISFRVTPLQAAEAGGARLLVSLIRRRPGQAHERGASEQRPPSDLGEELQLANAELEASREELQALNEELRAANDQLNFANEELNGANASLREKIDELETQSNVLSSGAVMTLFLDEEQRVRFFTPGVGELFPLHASDVGRPITDFVPRFDHRGLLERVQAVMRTGEPSEVEVRNRAGRWFMTRIRPFRIGLLAPSGAGVAITFTDITERKHAAEAMQRLQIFSRAANAARTVGELLAHALEALMSAYGADLGSIQLLEPGAGGEPASLRLAAQRGFPPWFAERFAQAAPSASPAWSRALEAGERIGISNIEDEAATAEQRELAMLAGFRSVQSAPIVSASGAALGLVSSYFREPRQLSDAEGRLADILANELANALERIGSEEAVRRNQAWLAVQNDAFQAAMNGAPLEESLGILLRAAVEQSGGGWRCAFYVDDPPRAPRRVAGAPEEPGGRWSFPIETSEGRRVGSFAVHTAGPREPSPRDRELTAMLTRTAAIIISRREREEQQPV